MDILSICSQIKEAIDSIKIPAIPIPPVLLALGGQFRSGISPSMVAANIIQRQSEAGAPFGSAADGSANIAEAMEVIRIEEIIKALKNDTLVQVAIAPGMINIVGTCATPSGPGTIVGVNATTVNGYGIIQ
jgi:hypothetical protein